jgi:nucleoside-diphosphate-sugar epimerase
MKHIAIFGAAGAIGHSIAAELDRRGFQYRTVGRSRERLAAAFPDSDAVAADLSNPESAEWAAGSIDTIFYAVGVDYSAFHLHPVLMRNTVNAAARAGVRRLVVITSVYSYGVPQTPKVDETHPREPHTRKGRMRKQQEDIALEAHRTGRLRAAVVHLPDFYGPHADLSMANPIFRAALAGKTANWLGSVNLPHEFLFVPDAGPVLVELAAREDSYGERWNLGGAGTITGRDFITRIYEEVSRKPKWISASKTMLRVLGLFNPLMREIAEMFYLAQTPVILDDGKLERHLGTLAKASYEDGIRRTLDWMRQPPGV